MLSRWIPMGSFLLAVAGLTAYVMVSGPASNAVVYAYDTEVEVTVEGPAAGELRAVAVDVDEVAPARVRAGSTTGLVITSARPVEVADSSQSAMPGELWAEVALVDGSAGVVPADTPTLVEVWLLEWVEGPVGSFSAQPVYALDAPVEVRLPVRAGDEEVADIVVEVTPVPLTGDDLGIPGEADVPDQRLPRPSAGQAVPTQLEDGRPVWVVGLDDDEVGVLDARSPHDGSGLVGWCGATPAFTDSPGASRFTPAGDYSFGPAPHGLTPYAVEVADDHVVVSRRLAPPAWPSDLDVWPPPGEIASAEQVEFCEIDEGSLPDRPDAYLEDYRGNHTWVQHDVSDWPHVDEARGDGWFRTDEVQIDGRMLVGEVLVERRRGRIVDAAPPPGVARLVFDDPAEESERVYELVQADREAGGVVLQDAFWVTADGLAPADAHAPTPRQLVTPPPSRTFRLASDARVEADQGELVRIVTQQGVVTQVTAVQPAR